MKQDLTPVDDLGLAFGTKSMHDFNYSCSQSGVNVKKSHIGFTVWDSDEDDDDDKTIDGDYKKRLDESHSKGVWITSSTTKWNDDIKKKTINNEARQFRNIMRQMQFERVKRPILVSIGFVVAIIVAVLFAFALYYFLTKGSIHFGGFCLADGNCLVGANLYCNQAYCACKSGTWNFNKCA